MNLLDRLGIYGFAWGKEPPSSEAFAALVAHAERAGVDSVHMPWHFTLSPKSFDWGNGRLLDPFVLLPFAAARTQRIRLGIDPWVPSVLHPFMWAQYLASLDAVAPGRVLSGVRAAWWRDDIVVGLSDESRNETGYDEGLEIVTRLWRGERLTGAESSTWDVAGLALDPVPAKPLPLWINGYEDAAIRRAARWGTTLRPLFLTADGACALRPKLDAAVAEHGRPVELATSTIMVVLDRDDRPEWVREHVHEPLARRLNGRPVEDAVIIGEPGKCAERLAQLFAAGVDYVLLDTQFHGWQTTGFSTEQIDRIAQGVAPLLAGEVAAA